MQKIINESAIASSRKPNNIRRNYNLPGKIVLDEEFQVQSQTEGLDAEQEDLLKTNHYIDSLFWLPAKNELESNGLPSF